MEDRGQMSKVTSRLTRESQLILDVVTRVGCWILRLQQVTLFSVLRKSRMRLFQWRIEKQGKNCARVKEVKRQESRGQGDWLCGGQIAGHIVLLINAPLSVVF